MKLSFIDDPKEALAFVLTQSPELLRTIQPADPAAGADQVYCAGQTTDGNRYFIIERRMKSNQFSVLLIEECTPVEAVKHIKGFYEWTKSEGKQVGGLREVRLRTSKPESN